MCYFPINDRGHRRAEESRVFNFVFICDVIKKNDCGWIHQEISDKSSVFSYWTIGVNCLPLLHHHLRRIPHLQQRLRQVGRVRRRRLHWIDRRDICGVAHGVKRYQGLAADARVTMQRAIRIGD